MSPDAQRELETLATIGEVALHVAHDLNNYFQVIMGNAALLMNRADSPEVHTKAEAIWKVADHSANLFRDFLRFSRYGAIQQEMISIGKVIKDLQMMLDSVAGNKGITLNLDLRDNSPVRAHRLQIEHIVLNLAMNARHAIQPPGQIFIGTADKEHQRGKYIMTTVSDTGSGLPRSTLEALRTGRGDRNENLPRRNTGSTPSRPHGGNGMGLKLIRTTVEQLGGFIEAASEPGHGSTFRVYLPACQ
jgi:two-component system cell cycle sensor histidine kinase/response regulator CckA